MKLKFLAALAAITLSSGIAQAVCGPPDERFEVSGSFCRCRPSSPPVTIIIHDAPLQVRYTGECNGNCCEYDIIRGDYVVDLGVPDDLCVKVRLVKIRPQGPQHPVCGECPQGVFDYTDFVDMIINGDC